MLAAAGMAPGALDPWEAWKVFKAFARTPVEAVVDDALVQYGVYEDEGGEERAHLYLVREFSEADPPGEGAAPATHLVCDLAFPPRALGGAPPAEFWTQDAPAFEAFVDRVEGAAGFQALVGARPTGTAVYLEEA
jgi:hypothetical protein